MYLRYSENRVHAMGFSNGKEREEGVKVRLKWLACVTSGAILSLGKQIWGRGYKFSLKPAESEMS